MEARIDLINALEAYRSTYATGYEVGHAIDILITELKLAEQDDE